MIEFTKEMAFNFASHIRAKTVQRGDELFFKACPYCNAQERDNQNKFSINLLTGQFQCKRASCNAHGNMFTLAKDFGFSLGRDADAYYGLSKNQYKRPIKVQKLPPRDEAVAYLSSRGISKETCERYGITTKKDDANVLVFPFRDPARSEEVVTIKYRKMDFDKERDKNKEWFESGMKPILFGMEECKTKTRLVITEGQIDSLSLSEADIPNAVSVPNGANGFTWVPYCWDWVNKFEEIVIFGDYERQYDRITLVEDIAKRFSRKKVFVVRMDDYKDCKDANEILQKYGSEQLRLAVANAELILNDDIIDMADVPDTRPEDSEAIRTGFEELDSVLAGGMHMGQLIVLTGKRGEGKSCFASQLTVNAWEQGYKTFTYSGELTNENVKAWAREQLAGKSDQSALEVAQINKWLRGKALMFDCNNISEELTDVAELVERAVCKYGCQFCVVDNLMTAMAINDSDIYLQQSLFVLRLTKIAKKHKCIILLVAHPKKGVMDGTDNDMISGSSHITDRADIVMSYYRDENEKEPLHDRKLAVSKNRLTGVLRYGQKAIGLDYDSKSRRIYDSNYGKLYEYGWKPDRDEDLFVSAEQLDIPF